MSAVIIKGKVVSKSIFNGKSRAGDPLVIHTLYVVNGGGAPVACTIINQENPYKEGDKIEVGVVPSVFRNEVSFTLARD